MQDDDARRVLTQVVNNFVESSDPDRAYPVGRGIRRRDGH